MQSMFNAQLTLCTISGKADEEIAFIRGGRSTGQFALNYFFAGLLQDDTAITPGDVVNDGTDNYLIVSVQHSIRAVKAFLYKTNASVQISDLTTKFVNNKPSGYYTETITLSGVPAVHDTVSAQLKLYDPGLLPSTVKRVLITNSYPAKILDRITIGTGHYQVDAVDDTKSPGLLWLQCSLDKRIVK